MDDNNQNRYVHLEWKPDILGLQGPYIKGRNIRVRLLVADFNSHYKGDYERMAKNRELPVEAIMEAVDWFNKNKAIAEIDAALEQSVLGIKE